MNPFKKLLQEIDEKVAEVKMLFAVILEKIDFEDARDQLKELVDILDAPNAAVNRKRADFVGARAEEALQQIIFWERKFLISEFALDKMRKRMTGLNSKTLNRHKDELSDRITRYDIVRSGRENLPELRRQFLSFKVFMRQIEGESVRTIHDTAKKAFLAPEIISLTSGSGVRRNKPAPKNPTNVGPTTKKGVNPGVNKEGGDGTSKDARQRQRKRAIREGRHNSAQRSA